VSYIPGFQNSGLRYREDTGIEHRCRYCPKGSQWWPLTSEFWDYKAGFGRCRACRDLLKRRSQARRLKESPERLLKFQQYQAGYQASAREVKAIKSRIYYWKDPELQRAKARERYQRKREEILEKRRQEYAARKAA
jgi:hypothetical protein